MAGYAYYVNREELIRYMNLSAEDKLTWLRRVIVTQSLLPKEVREIQNIFSEYNYLDSQIEAGGILD